MRRTPVIPCSALARGCSSPGRGPQGAGIARGSTRRRGQIKKRHQQQACRASPFRVHQDQSWSLAGRARPRSGFGRGFFTLDDAAHYASHGARQRPRPVKGEHAGIATEAGLRRQRRRRQHDRERAGGDDPGTQRARVSFVPSLGFARSHDARSIGPRLPRGNWRGESAGRFPGTQHPRSATLQWHPLLASSPSPGRGRKSSPAPGCVR